MLQAKDTDAHATSRTLLRTLFDHAVEAVSPRQVMPAVLPSAPHGRLVAIAVGKAAAEMMRVAQSHSKTPLPGLVVTRHGHLGEGATRWPEVEVIEAGHPFPDASSVRAAERALEIAHGLQAGDELLVLLSGGGSALLALPAEGVSLADKQEVTRALLQSGATIAEINCVRKHLSRIKGGRLAVAAGAAHVTTWIISDIPGDDPSFVSSGPTVADQTTLAMAREVIAEYHVAVPASVAAALDDPGNETPEADSLGLAGGETAIIGRARTALGAAREFALAHGYAVTDLGDQLQAEARHLGASHAALARRLAGDGQRRLILSGGEATVTVTNQAGRGGRNLEYLLGLAIALGGAAGISAIACDTDGIDGTEAVAGAIVTPDTLARAAVLGLDPAAHLARNDAYPFFEALGDLVVTGPTLTNVNDFRAILYEGGV
ncbi:glycerate kinase [Sphingosinicella sp. LHD-64]|uniref:glycerate kinase type-2 family protein n=1 Tax=Sphingosinicella sp. LHD-64 TaxID=3072139 RepID=UPI00280CBF85|nr:glycerate kinase [Sphingosinicella sp. LHD-64]MDQ8757112.1 glycerate kinase [Sphingosinicella sp. LHD-64]